MTIELRHSLTPYSSAPGPARQGLLAEFPLPAGSLFSQRPSAGSDCSAEMQRARGGWSTPARSLPQRTRHGGRVHPDRASRGARRANRAGAATDFQAVVRLHDAAFPALLSDAHSSLMYAHKYIKTGADVKQFLPGQRQA